MTFILADLLDLMEGLAPLIGVVIAVVLIFAIPSWRKGVLSGFQAGRMLGEKAAKQATGEELEGGVEEEPVVTRHPACPGCGSKRYRLAATSLPWGDSPYLAGFQIKDRTCKDCETTYHPAMPAFVKWVFLFLGGVINLFGWALLFNGEIGSGLFCILAGTLGFALGWNLRKPQG